MPLVKLFGVKQLCKAQNDRANILRNEMALLVGFVPDMEVEGGGGENYSARKVTPK